MTGASAPVERAAAGVARQLLVTAGLMMAPAIGLGFGRFAYALVLPRMKADLHWSFATAGAMNTANAVGYLVGAAAAARVAARYGERRTFLVGTALSVLAILATAATAATPVLLALRLVAGIGAAGCAIVGAGLTTRVGSAGSHGLGTTLLGVYWAGSGLAIIVSGWTVPEALRAAGWRGAWLVLGGMSLLGMAVAAAAAFGVDDPQGGGGDRRARWQARRLMSVVIGYCLFGAGYIAYMTFVVALLTGEGVGRGEITLFWTVLGGTAILAPLFWGRLLGRMPIGPGLTLVLGLLALAAAVVVWSDGLPWLLASAALFGGTFLTVTAAMSATPRRVLPAAQWTAAIGGLTTAFALGQCVGPVLSGVLSDRAGGVGIGLGIGAVLCALAAIATLTQRGRPD